jgi:hypothetical protein
VAAGGAAHPWKSLCSMGRWCYERWEAAVIRISSAEGDGGCCCTLRGARRGGSRLLDGTRRSAGNVGMASAQTRWGGEMTKASKHLCGDARAATAA